MIIIQSSTRKIRFSRIILQLRNRSNDPQVQLYKPVEYPKILDLSPKSAHRREQEAYFDKLKNIGSVEEKLFSLNLPKYYGWPSFLIREGVIPYNYLPFSQFITRTEISENRNLPLFTINEQAQKLKNRIKIELEKVILFENAIKYKHELERLYLEEEKAPYYSEGDLRHLKTKHTVNQVNSAIVRCLATEYPHLLRAQMDIEPRAESFWRVGGFYPTESDIKLRNEKEIDESMVHDPIDRFIQYIGSPILQLRSTNPLQPLPKIKRVFTSGFKATESPILQIIGSRDKASEVNKNNLPATSDGYCNEVQKNKTTELEVLRENPGDLKILVEDGSYYYPWQEYRYSPDLYLGIPRERNVGSVVPGFWPNDSSRFGILSYHSSCHLSERPFRYGEQDAIEALHAQAILASYAWTYAQATYQGFSTYHDVTYPFPSQTVLTDGKVFSFYQYQMNTTVLHSNYNEESNPKYNECFATAPMELFHKVGIDRVEGWNNDAILNLVAMYTNVPIFQPNIDLCPYLNKQRKYISQIENDEERVWWHGIYRFATSRRPRIRKIPEIYDWERIYKIEHQRRVTDARKRFFEKFEDPLNDRKFDDHAPPYIPKKFRAHKKLGRLAKQFYPQDVHPSYHEIV